MTLGDSKTTTASNTWPNTLAFARRLGLYDLTVSAATICGNDERLTIVAANMTAILAANGQKGNTSLASLILLNLGTHDILASNTLDAAAHTAFVTDYQTVLDAFHAAQPTADIYCHRDWTQAKPDARSDTIDDWIDEAVASRAFAHAGPDERLWFKPNVATYSADGTHYYTASGQAGCVAAWQAVLP